MNSIIAKISPKTYFIIDALGALGSAFMLGVVLVMLEDMIGMPANVLYVLALIAVLFFCHSMYCYLKTIENWRSKLRKIAIANLLYCGLTLALTVIMFQKLTALGVAYFIVEIIIIVTLSLIELKVAKRP